MPDYAGMARKVMGTLRGLHASPHDFERFDISKIGNGQGAQTFGRGLYFAENPAVLEDYYKEFQRNQPWWYTVAGQRATPEQHAAIWQLRGNPEYLNNPADIINTGGKPWSITPEMMEG